MFTKMELTLRHNLSSTAAGFENGSGVAEEIQIESQCCGSEHYCCDYRSPRQNRLHQQSQQSARNGHSGGVKWTVVASDSSSSAPSRVRKSSSVKNCDCYCGNSGGCSDCQARQCHHPNYLDEDNERRWHNASLIVPRHYCPTRKDCSTTNEHYYHQSYDNSNYHLVEPEQGTSNNSFITEQLQDGHSCCNNYYANDTYSLVTTTFSYQFC